jgi:hypothetical protein
MAAELEGDDQSQEKRIKILIQAHEKKMHYKGICTPRAKL